MASKIAKPIRPPRLRMKEELLKEDPELATFLEEAFNSASPTIAARRPPTAGAADMLTLGIDDELTEEEELKLELESVKRERRALMDSLAALKADQGKAGSERQMSDIARLRRELESKQEKMNELRQEASKAEGQLVRLALTSRDCAALMPDGGPNAQARIGSLEAELHGMESELAEADAQHRLYSLLEERTRQCSSREHFVQDQKVKAAKEALDAFAEDHVVLTSHMHMARFSRENTERDLAAVKAQREAVRTDWQRKLQDCRKEVRGMEHRQKREAEAEEQRRAKQAELDAQERERAAAERLEQDAFERQLQSLQPKVEKMEAAWARLHTITGAETPEEVIAYFEGLKSKEASMMELVRLAEYAESKAKEDIAALLNKRSAMLEALTAINDDESSEHNEEFAHLELRTADARERQEAATKQYNRLCSICIAAQQARATGP
ncbi:g317 [Coccomyxa viridis]|uniref:G317 protein n=1 Tax=Coccomyxa viridis TaxID=1274662 RepID=A0ABP1FKR9_9CHLO